MTSIKNHELNRIQRSIGKYAKQYQEKQYNDDRRIVVNVYNTLVKGIEQLPEYIEPWLRVAIKKELQSQLTECYKIIERFENVKIID